MARRSEAVKSNDRAGDGGELDLQSPLLSRRTALRWGAGLGAAGFAAVRGPRRGAAHRLQASGNVTFTHWWGPPAPYGVVMEEQALPAFAEANPEIKVDSRVIAFDDIFTTLQTQLAAGAPPDLTMIAPQNFTPLFARDVFVDLEPYVTASSTTLDRSDVYPAALERVTKDGRLFGVPTDVNVFLLYWNEDMFAEAGVNPPSPEWTWDDLLDAAIKLTKGSGASRQYGLYLPPWEIAVWAHDGEILSEDERSVRLNEPAASEAITWLADLVNVHQASPSFPGAQFGNPSEDVTILFETGRLGMIINGSHFIGQLLAADPDFVWNVAPVPRWTTQATIVQGASLAIFKDGRNPEAAWRLIDFLSSIPSQEMWARAGLLPMRISAASAFLDRPNLPSGIGAIPESLAFSRPRPFVARYAEMMAIVNRELEAAISLNEKSAQEATDAIKREVDPLLAG